MVATDLELHKLVDLSLRTPEVGVVNFNHLHKLLHAILDHIGLRYDGKNITKVYASKSPVSESKTRTDHTSEAEDVKDEGDTEATNETEKEKEHASTEESTVVSEQETLKSPTNAVRAVQEDEIERLQSVQRYMQSKISELEEKLKILDALPTNRSIIEKAQQSESTNQLTSKDNALAGIWQFLKINSRLLAAEEAIDRIMNILNEFLGSGKSVGELNDNLQDIAKELSNLKSQINNNNDAISSTEHQEAMGKIEEIQRKLSGLASKEDLREYVKWPALENALNAGKQRNSSAKNETKTHTEDAKLDDSELESSTPEDGRPKTVPVKPTQSPVPTPEVPKTAMTRSEFTQVTSNDLPDKEPDKDADDAEDSSHPSQEMRECLRQIGELSDKNRIVEEQVKVIKEVLPNKIDKTELDIPEDLKNRIDAMQADLDSISQKMYGNSSGELDELRQLYQENRDKIEAIKRELAAMARQAKQAYIQRPSSGKGVDNEAMDNIRALLKDVQDEQEKAAKKMEYKLTDLQDDLSQKREHIEALYNYVQKLQDSKADKDNVAIEMDIKADKEALDSKVSLTTFDNSFNMLDEGLREALQKMDDYMNEELALKQALKQLSCEMKEKMDGQAFKAMQDFLERRIADVQKSRNMIAREAKVELTGAAGIRRPLLNFHCISCNRPVEVPYNRDAQQSLPSPQAVKLKRSKGPYISYEMDQIRHYQRTFQQPALHPIEKPMNEFVAKRPCGGSHTVLNHTIRKPTRIVSSQLSNVLAASVRDDPTAHVPNWSREISVIDLLKGKDGHVYRGRYKAIPPISRSHKHTPSESDLPPLHKDPVMPGPRWNSEPQLSRGGDEFQPLESFAPRQGETIGTNESQVTTPPPTTNQPSVLPPREKQGSPLRVQGQLIAVPSPSPPAAQKNEHQHRIEREEFLQSQQPPRLEGEPQGRISPGQRLFSPRHARNGSPCAQQISPTSQMQHQPGQRLGGDAVKVTDEPVDGRLSVDSIDEVVE